MAGRGGEYKGDKVENLSPKGYFRVWAGVLEKATKLENLGKGYLAKSTSTVGGYAEASRLMDSMDTLIAATVTVR